MTSNNAATPTPTVDDSIEAPPTVKPEHPQLRQMIAFVEAVSVPRRRVPERAVEILSVHVSASRLPKAPVRTESTLLSHEEATRTDRQLCETSRSCCCTAVAQGQEMAPRAVLATGATRR